MRLRPNADLVDGRALNAQVCIQLFVPLHEMETWTLSGDYWLPSAEAEVEMFLS
jgi:hypothetical protein